MSLKGIKHNENPFEVSKRHANKYILCRITDNSNNINIQVVQIMLVSPLCEMSWIFS